MGTLGAQGNNGQGVAGVCWNADLISYKVFNQDDDQNNGAEWPIYGSLQHLVQWKQANHITATIPVNMSLGSDYADAFQVDMIQNALANNVVVIAAMGNDGAEYAEYPAAFEGVIAVGASDGRDQMAAFSSSGSAISVCAPGLNIISTGPSAGRLYFMDSGTSMATPFVTGLVGYMLTFQPNLTPAQIKTELQSFADPLLGGYNLHSGFGRVNVLNTIKNVATLAAAGLTPAQSYNDNPLKVTVLNTLVQPPEPVPGVPVYLYATDASGNILNYVSCTFTDAAGLAPFSLLNGTYMATAVLSGLAFNTSVVTVTASDSVAIAPQTLKIPVSYGQVLSDQGPYQLPYGRLALAGDFYGFKP